MRDAGRRPSRRQVRDACLGRPASMHEVREWCRSAGSSQYYGMKATCFRSRCGSVTSRRTESARHDYVVDGDGRQHRAVPSSQLWARLVEHAAEKGDTRFLDKDSNPRWLWRSEFVSRSGRRGNAEACAAGCKATEAKPRRRETPAATPTVVVANPLDPGEKLAVPSLRSAREGGRLSGGAGGVERKRRGRIKN